MIKVSDLIADILANNGIEHVFMVTGGGAMHLNNSLGKHPKLEYVCCHHEQACAMAAESYARLTGRMAAVNVTTGPGGINAMNGVFGAWTDSIPMIVISGQVRYDTTVYSTGMNLRQLGDQEFAKVIDAVSTMTKYAVMIIDPLEIKYHVEKAIFLAQSGRPGPVWVDIPMNVQGYMIDENILREYDPIEDNSEIPPMPSEEIIDFVIEKFNKSQRPVLLVGSGVRIAKAFEELNEFVNLLKIPVVTAWNAHDLIENENPFYIGRPGTIGDRAGNFAVQNSDLLIVLGSRLNIRQIGYNFKTFAREAFKIMVDIDVSELKKPTLEIDLPIHADLKKFLSKINNRLRTISLNTKNDWMVWCSKRKEMYPIVLKKYWDKESPINPYCFMEKLFENLDEGQIIVSGDGTACVTSFQTAYIKKGQRLYTNSGSASMGYDLPAAIGACIGAGFKKIVCLAGDGSIMMNIQELSTISYLHLPIKIFLLNNNGYHSIRQTQKNFFEPPQVGVGPESGLGFPDFEILCKSFGIEYSKCDTHSSLEDFIKITIEGNKPSLCEVILDLEQQFEPKQSSLRLENGQLVSKPLEDLAPFLPREEFKNNMIIPIIP
ncbi:MAG: thiamine pyrophosphate-binding protein [Stygiobacter sp.]